MLVLDGGFRAYRRDTLCLSVALALHLPLLWWKAKPDLGPISDPIAEVDFIVEAPRQEAPPPPPPPERIGMTKSLFRSLAKAVGMNQPPKPVASPIVAPPPPVVRQEAQLSGMVTRAIQVKKTVSEEAPSGPKLVAKNRAQGPSFDLAKLPDSSSSLIAGSPAPGPLGGGGTLKTKSSGFRVAAGDLPFQVQRTMAGVSDEEAPRVVLADRTDKNVKSLSREFFGSGGGLGGGDGKGLVGGGGDGSGGGGTLKDKGAGHGTGLAGTGGGFNGIDTEGVSGSGSRGGGGLSGAPSTGHGGGPSAGSGRLPYELEGPLSNRQILTQVLPPYPDWARDKGVMAAVKILFYVRHSGEVRKNPVIQRTSGYPRLDEAALEAIQQWRFAPLEGAAAYGKEQYGIITFKFRAI